jgi:hypothetical protein
MAEEEKRHKGLLTQKSEHGKYVFLYFYLKVRGLLSRPFFRKSDPTGLSILF